LHIHQLWILSPFLHDIYYQQYYEDQKRECVTAVLNNAVFILMLEYTFVFVGVEAGRKGGVSIILRVYFYIKVAYYYYYYYYYYYS
jgi:hypothetical protein